MWFTNLLLPSQSYVEIVYDWVARSFYDNSLFKLVKEVFNRLITEVYYTGIPVNYMKFIQKPAIQNIAKLIILSNGQKVSSLFGWIG